VTDINLELHKGNAELRVPVIVELEPDRILSVSDKSNVSNEDVMAKLIKKGLRAQLQVGSLVTGQLLIDLDFHPESKLIAHDNHSIYPEFPTVASSLEEIAHSAQIIMDKLAKLPLDKLTQQMDKTLASLEETSKTAKTTLTVANGALSSAQNTLYNAGETMISARQTLKTIEPGSTGYYEFHTLMQELTQATRSVKQLTDYLEQHPESLIRGKEDNHE
jgi:paraquat-inducible protein B